MLLYSQNWNRLLQCSEQEGPMTTDGLGFGNVFFFRVLVMVHYKDYLYSPIGSLPLFIALFDGRREWKEANKHSGQASSSTQLS